MDATPCLALAMAPGSHPRTESYGLAGRRTAGTAAKVRQQQRQQGSGRAAIWAGGQRSQLQRGMRQCSAAFSLQQMR